MAVTNQTRRYSSIKVYTGDELDEILKSLCPNYNPRLYENPKANSPEVEIKKPKRYQPEYVGSAEISEFIDSFDCFIDIDYELEPQDIIEYRKVCKKTAYEKNKS